MTDHKYRIKRNLLMGNTVILAKVLVHICTVVFYAFILAMRLRTGLLSKSVAPTSLMIILPFKIFRSFPVPAMLAFLSEPLTDSVSADSILVPIPATVVVAAPKLFLILIGTVSSTCTRVGTGFVNRSCRRNASVPTDQEITVTQWLL